MQDTTLGGRLLSVAGFVRQGAVFADIGTDHAHLPIFLLENGVIERAVCSDINEGPLSLARANVAAAGLADKVDFMLTDGCCGLEEYGATDFAVCGMGGELIADIVARSPFLKNPHIRLILQPMTKQAHLRAAICKMGFSIVDEVYSTDEGKHYLCIVCSYCGVNTDISNAEAEIGLKMIKNINLSSQLSYFKVKINALRKKIDGLCEGGINADGERGLLGKMLERAELIEEKMRSQEAGL